MSKEIHYCDVCGVSSEEKRVNFIKNANMYLCRKHREQFMKFGEFKDSNPRGVFDPNEVRILEDYAEIDTYDSSGNIVETFILDKDDVEKLGDYKWRTVYKNDKPYLFTGNQKKEKIYFHRLVMNNPEIQVDHISGNTLDNRKENLRMVSAQDNMKNLKKKKDNTSGIRGVSFSERDQQYKVDFTYEKKRMYFKTFDTKAHAVYLRYLLEKEFLKDFRNTSNDEEYFSYINSLSNIEKWQIETYFKKRLNTLKGGV